MINKKAAAYIRSHIRQGWRYYDDNRKYVRSHSNVCKNCGSTSDLCVDHIKPVGHFDIGDVDRYLKRMFCGKNNLQTLCSKCNSKKRNK